MPSDSFPRDAAAALGDRGPEGYGPGERRGFDAARERALRLLADTLGDGLAPEHADPLLADLVARLEALAPQAYDGANPARTDAGDHYDLLLDQALSRRRHNGAVHLELGTWTAFGEQRVQEIVAREGLAEFVRVDFEPGYEMDVAGDVRVLPLRDASVDSVAHNSLLEHVPHPHAVIAEAFRVLRPGGVMHVVTPYVWPLHPCPGDFLRYTPLWYREICAEVGFVSVETDVAASSGLYNVLHNISKAALVDPADPAAEQLRALHVAVVTLLAALVPLDRRFAGGAEHWFHSVRVTAVKPGRYRPHGRPARDERRFADRSLDLLQCPATRTPLTRHGDEVVSAAGTRYPVVAGVPNLVVPYVAPTANPPGARTRARRLVGRQLDRRLGGRLGVAARRAVRRRLG